MMVGRVTKEINDRRRVVVSFDHWLDPAEVVSVVSTPTVAVDPAAIDSTPLVVETPVLTGGGTGMNVFLTAGTAGLVYLVAMTITGSASGRVETLEFYAGITPPPALTITGTQIPGPTGPQGPTGPAGPQGPGITEAPSDDFYYGRNSATWQKVLPDWGGDVNGDLRVHGNFGIYNTAIAEATFFNNGVQRAQLRSNSDGSVNFVRWDGTGAYQGPAWTVNPSGSTLFTCPANDPFQAYTAAGFHCRLTLDIIGQSRWSIGPWGTDNKFRVYDETNARPAMLIDPAANEAVTLYGALTGVGASFTTLSASSTVSGTGFTSWAASPPSIGATTPAAGAFTTLSASSTVSGTGFTNRFASPGPIGSTAASTGAFTTLSASLTISASAGSGLAVSYGDTVTANSDSFAYSYIVGSSSGAIASLGLNHYFSTGGASTRPNTSKNGWWWQHDVRNATNDGPLVLRVISSAGSAATALTVQTDGSLVQSSGGLSTTTLAASSTVSGAGFTAWAASPPSIGSTAPGTGAFTTLSASSTVSGAGFTSWAASPPAIGGTAANTGRFTTVTSTQATGTPPFTVASTTNVANLNASSLNGATMASPGPVGATTPSTGVFTTVTATSAYWLAGGANNRITSSLDNGGAIAGSNVNIHSFNGMAWLQTSGATGAGVAITGYASATMAVRSGSLTLYGAMTHRGTLRANSAQLSTSGTTVTLDTGGQVAAVSSIAAAGSGYVTGDRLYDANNTVYTVTATAGAITALAVDIPQVVFGATPSNPVTLTTATGVGTGGTANLSWTQATTLALNPSGSVTASQINVTTAAGPNIRAGTGAGTGTQPAGSLWLRTDGGTGTRLYVSAGAGTWNAVAGV